MGCLFVIVVLEMVFVSLPSFCHNFGFVVVNSCSVTVPTLLLVVVERFVAAAHLSSLSVSSFSLDWYFGAFEGKFSFAST